MTETESRRTADWVSSPGRFSLIWGLPLSILVLAPFAVNPAVKTWAWFVALVWMGAACLVNATRCGRRHCYFTGPFFIVMAIVVLLHGYYAVWLGPNGWWWLSLALGAGGGLLWYLPEHRWGRYAARDDSDRC